MLKLIQTFNILKTRYPFERQLDSTDCGIACMRMILKYYKREYPSDHLKGLIKLTRQGSSLESLRAVADTFNLKALTVKLDLEKLRTAPLPAIIFWDFNHFVVLYKIKKDQFLIADPSCGIQYYPEPEFKRHWIGNMERLEHKGVGLLLEPTQEFWSNDHTPVRSQNNALRLVSKHFKKFTIYFALLLVALLIGSIIQLAFPFLTQAIVDYGIRYHDKNFISLILFGLVFFYSSSIAIDFIRSRILIHVGSRINILLISDFLTKLMRLPQAFFESSVVGDLIQRIRDHKRIESFVTDNLVKSLFSIFNLAILSAALIILSSSIFFIFCIGTILETVWVLSFLSRIKIFDNKSFQLQAEDHNKTYEIITGIQEIKLNNLEGPKKKHWESTQFELFNINIKKLKLDQLQKGGQRLLNHIQATLIIFFSALAVVHHEMSLGSMMAIIFIQAQLTATVSILVNSLSAAQFAKISLERLNEVHSKESEEDQSIRKITSLPRICNIRLKDVSFSYGGTKTKVLKKINLEIPERKITAIVGASGSGKTTLLKLLLKLNEPEEGQIMVGAHDLKEISTQYWRSQCGAVMQDSFVFSDSIAKNIALTDHIDYEKLMDAARIANLNTFIESLPFGYNTRIGRDGMGISKGQMQRILIARAVYKNPQYLFFDEATNSLDANNEFAIMNNLHEFFQDRTVIIVAHRLSTVKNADQIVVLDQGEIVELGDHAALFQTKGMYSELIKNQTQLSA